jgi:hypothetical protein
MKARDLGYIAIIAICAFAFSFVMRTLECVLAPWKGQN